MKGSIEKFSDLYNQESEFQTEKNGLVVIGGGGGSDVIQARQVAALSRKKRVSLISIRTASTTSQNVNGIQGESRTIQNHGGEIFPGVFIVTPESTGTGRFIEFIPAQEMPIYLIIDHNDGNLTNQIQAVLDHFGNVTHVTLVDTGGDILYRAQNSIEDSARATPDQDLRSLRAVNGLKKEGIKKSTAIVAPGIDTPPYYKKILKQTKAFFYKLNPEETFLVLNIYKRYDFTGHNPARYGKTPFAWQAALKGERGDVRLPIPAHLVNHPTNPWNNLVTITDEMAGIYFIAEMNLHFLAITNEDIDKNNPENNTPGVISSGENNADINENNLEDNAQGVISGDENNQNNNTENNTLEVRLLHQVVYNDPNIVQYFKTDSFNESGYKPPLFEQKNHLSVEVTKIDFSSLLEPNNNHSEKQQIPQLLDFNIFPSLSLIHINTNNFLVVDTGGDVLDFTNVVEGYSLVD